MKKLFYKVEMRMGKVHFESNSETEMILENSYSNKGCCLVEENEIKGVLTEDSIHITIKNNFVSLTSIIYDYIEKNGIILLTQREIKLKRFLEYEFYLPIRIILVGQSSDTKEMIGVDLNFIKKEENITIQKELIRDLEKKNLL